MCTNTKGSKFNCLRFRLKITVRKYIIWLFDLPLPKRIFFSFFFFYFNLIVPFFFYECLYIYVLRKDRINLRYKVFISSFRFNNSYKLFDFWIELHWLNGKDCDKLRWDNEIWLLWVNKIHYYCYSKWNYVFQISSFSKTINFNVLLFLLVYENVFSGMYLSFVIIFL